MKAISRLRFDALAGYARQPFTKHLFQEVAWFQHGDERVLGVVVRDRVDGDYTGAIFGRDRRGRYRAISLVLPFQTQPNLARRALRGAMERLSAQPNESFYQGDEKGKSLDFFEPQVAEERQHPSFQLLLNQAGQAAAKGIIQPMMHWFEDPDGNFIDQFQSHGFDARLWELYLFAAFKEMGYEFDRSKAIPDFTCIGMHGHFCVEAVTVNPTIKDGVVQPPPLIQTNEDLLRYQREYMPIKFGSALTSKLNKRYWEKPNIAGNVFLLAVQDFSAPGVLLDSRSALPIYLYGRDHDWEYDSNGRLIVSSRAVETHRWGEKVIPSGFFSLPNAEHISGILYSNSATLSKFNRMGVLAGFGRENVSLIRQGFMVSHDPNATEPIPFSLDVNSPNYSETWSEGLELYHNPNALHPLNPQLLPDIAHYHLLSNGELACQAPSWHPLTSITHIIVGI